MNYLLRRMKLGKTSCNGISKASQTGIEVYRNDAKLPKGDIVFRWGCTSNVEADVIINQAKAIHLVSDKLKFRTMLNEVELCPLTWIRLQDIKYPCIIRPSFHAQGRNLWVCNNNAEARAAISRYACADGWYASAIINKVAEYRVFVAQGRAVWVANKTPGNPDDIAWNVARGGKFNNVRWDGWPLKAVKRSIEANKLSGLDFGGVDVLVDKDGEVYILEINSAPSQTSEYRQGCVAKAFDYMIKNGHKEIPLMEARGGYTKFIHPGVCNGALI